MNKNLYRKNRGFYEKRGNMQNSLEDTKFILKKYNISANKKLGQNFLIDDNIINEIIDSSNVNKNDLIIEIGPGLGTLTAKLLENAGKVIAIELDDRMIKILSDRFKLYDNFTLIHNDVLKIDLNQIIKENIENLDNVKVVANLPYYITTPIIMKLLEDRVNIQSITVMVQKEVAERITATPGDKLSGAITYSIDYYAEAKEVVFVSKECFMPSPEVDSEVIKLTLRDKPKVNVVNEELFFKIIKASFSQRRKTLLNGLANSGIINNKEKLKEILEDMGLNLEIRGEKLSIEQFADLADRIDKEANSN